jgi:AcrR family transcriptional regulator
MNIAKPPPKHRTTVRGVPPGRDEPAAVLQRRGGTGEALGQKARLTRRRLIETTMQLLETAPLHKIKIVDIAQQAETSPATFYLYFANVRAVLLAASVEVSQSTPTIIRILNEEWAEANSANLSMQLVQEYIEFWACHRSLFLARNLAADKGDPDFLSARSWSVRPMAELLQEKIEHAHRQGRSDSRADPLAISSMVMMLLERVGSFSPGNRNNRRATHQQLVTATAEMIHRAVGYRR